MNEAKLILDIGADVSQFNRTISEVRAKIKSLTTDLKSATGANIGEINLDLTQLKRTEDTLARFSTFAEGTLGALKAKLATLKQERLEIQIGDTAKFEEYSRKIDETATSIKNLENIGKQKVVEVIDPVAINSIEFFKQEIDSLTQKKSKISIDTVEGRAQIALLVNTIEYYKERIAEANAIGKSFDPIPNSAINSINYFKQQIESIKERRAKISIDTVEGRAEIASLTNQIDEYQDKITKAETIGKSTEFVDLNTIKGIRARLAELENIRVNIDINDGGDIAQLNAEIAQLRKQLNDLDDINIDKSGALVRGSAKARQSLVNLGLVAQDLPFGFIAIQNNIPNLVSSFTELSLEAKKTGVSVGTQLASQFKGAAGAIFGIGLAFTAVTATVTYLVQKYGSLSAAFDALLGKVNPLQKVIDRASKSLEDFGKNYKTVGESIADANASAETQVIKLEALTSTILDVTKTENARKAALEELQSLDNQRFKNFDIEKGKLEGLKGAVLEYTNAVLARAVAEKLADRTAEALAAREIQRNLYSEQIKVLDDVKKKYPEVEKAAADYQKKQLAYIEQVKQGNRGAIAPIAAPGVNDFLKASKTLNDYEKDLISLNDTYVDSRKVTKEATEQVQAFGGSLNDVKEGAKIKFEFEVPKTEEFLQFERFFDLQKAFDRLKQYGDILLDVNAKEKDRAKVLGDLQTQQTKVLGDSAKFFTGLQIGVSSYDALSQAVANYAFALEDAIIKENELASARATPPQFKLSDYAVKGLKGVNFDDLDSDIIKKQFDRIKELAKGLPSGVMPSFEEFKTLLQELLTLESFKTTEGTLGFDQIIAFSEEKLAELRQTIIDAKIKETLGNIYGGEETANIDPLQNLNDLADKFQKTSKKFQDTIARGLEKPFRDFFDTLLEEGKVNLDSFVDLFKDMIKRIAAQLISAGIAKLLTTILMPQAAVGGALAGAASGGGGPTGILKFLVGLFGGGGKSFNDINFGGMQGGGMQMSGQVVFTQRGSDLVGVLNRTNGTINRVG